MESAGLSFLALYAMRTGWSELAGTNLVSAMMFGAIVLQLPIGWLGDRVDRLRLVAVLALLSAAGALAGPVAAGFAMDLGLHGLPVYVAVVCLAFFAYVCWDASSRPASRLA